VLKSDLGPADPETNGKTQAGARQKTKGK